MLLATEAAAQTVCNWEEIEPVPGVRAEVTSLTLRRAFLALRLGPGQLYGLRVCDRTVGLLYLGQGEVDVGSPGPQRTPQMHGRSPDLPGTVLLDAAWIVGADGAVEDLLEQAGGLQEGPVPPNVWSLAQARANGFQRNNTDWWQPPGDVLAAPEGATGGLMVEVRTQGMRATRPERSLEVLSPWLTWMWSPAGSTEPGRWFRRPNGSTRYLLYGGFPSEEAVAEQGTPFALEALDPPWDLEEASVGVAASGPIGPDRMLQTLEGTAALTLRAREGASRHVLLSLVAGTRRTYGELWAPLQVRAVSTAGSEGTEPVAVPWLRTGGRLWVTLPEDPAPGDEIGLVVRYEGDLLEPAGNTSIRLLGPEAWYPRPPGVDRHRFTATVAVPPFWEVIATGHRIGEEVTGRVKTVTSRANRPVRAGSVLIADVRTEVVKTGEGLPLVRIHRNPEQPIPNARFGQELNEHLEVLRDVLGPFPWSELEIVERGIGAAGRIDLAGLIAVPRFDSPPDQVVTTRAGGDSLLGALARQWLAVDRGVETYHDSWLVTGLVTWARCLALEEAGHGGRCYGELANGRRAWVDAMTSGQFSNDPTMRALMAGSVWNGGGTRGALVLHSLRLLVGDDVVKATLRKLAQSDGNITLSSFLVAAQDTAGRDLRAFVYGWVLNTPPLPTAKLRYQLTEDEDGTWTLSGLGVIESGVETDPPLPLPTPLLLAYDVGQETNVLRIVLTETEAALKIEGLPGKPRNIKLDPGKTFPGKIELERLDK